MSALFGFNRADRSYFLEMNTNKWFFTCKFALGILDFRFSVCEHSQVTLNCNCIELDEWVVLSIVLPFAWIFFNKVG